MNTLQITKQDHYAIIQLDRGTSNAINLEMFKELEKAFNDLQADNEVLGVVLTGKGSFFSAGLDVIELYNYDAQTIEALFVALHAAMKAMLSFSKPTVASITGHSPAGGCVLAICCDYRVMAEGKYRIGLNEIPVGIVMPQFIYNLYAYWLGAGRAAQCILEGKLMLAEEAQPIGLVDKVVPLEDVLSESILQLQKYMKLNASTWQKSKVNIRKSLIADFDNFDKSDLDIILKQWWSPETRQILGGLVAHLTKK